MCRYALCVTSPENKSEFAGFVALKSKIGTCTFQMFMATVTIATTSVKLRDYGQRKMHTTLLLKGFS